MMKEMNHEEMLESYAALCVDDYTDLLEEVRSLKKERKALLIMRVKLSHGLQLTPAEEVLLTEQVRMQTELIDEVYNMQKEVKE